MLPTFIIIGAMKSGTTSLYHYLKTHPEIIMPKKKELDFFVEQKNYDKGIKWYESNFNGMAKAYGEASPNYSKYPTFDGVPKRLYSILPEAKLIYIIRDPVERTISHYMHNYIRGTENADLSSLLLSFDKNHYINCSKYYMQLERYLEYYSMDRILIITSDQLRYNRQETLENIFSFLEVDKSFYAPEYSEVHNQTEKRKRKSRFHAYVSNFKLINKMKSKIPSFLTDKYKNSRIMEHTVRRPKLDEKLKENLREYFGHDVESLRKLTGNDFRHWGI